MTTMKKVAFLLIVLLCWGCSSLLNVASHGVGGRLPGYQFGVESCVGNAAEGKAYVTFTYIHRLAPQTVTLLSGNDTYAVDHMGNRYPAGYTGSQSVLRTQPGVPQKVTMEIRGIPPGISAFSIVSCRVKAATEGVTEERSTVLTFRNIPIVWQ